MYSLQKKVEKGSNSDLEISEQYSLVFLNVKYLNIWQYL